MSRHVAFALLLLLAPVAAAESPPHVPPGVPVPDEADPFVTVLDRLLGGSPFLVERAMAVLLEVLRLLHLLEENVTACVAVEAADPLARLLECSQSPP